MVGHDVKVELMQKALRNRQAEVDAVILAGKNRMMTSVTLALSEGLTWAEIGEAFDISASAMAHRYDKWLDTLPASRQLATRKRVTR